MDARTSAGAFWARGRGCAWSSPLPQTFRERMEITAMRRLLMTRVSFAFPPVRACSSTDAHRRRLAAEMTYIGEGSALPGEDAGLGGADPGGLAHLENGMGADACPDPGATVEGQGHQLVVAEELGPGHHGIRGLPK